MSAVEIRCPNCGSPSVTKKGKEYRCENCQQYFLIITQPVQSKKQMTSLPSIKFGKVTFNVNDAMQLGKFTLNPKVNVTYLFFEIFRYHAYRRVVRGSKPIEADEFGYIFVSPFTGKIDYLLNKSNRLPAIDDFKQPFYQEVIRVIESPSFDDKPLGPMDVANVLPLTITQNKTLTWLIHNLVVKKAYIQSTAIQKKGGDLGIRTIELKFSKNDFKEFTLLGIFATPIFNLGYRLPNSQNIFRRSFGGYSGLLLNDELKCSKTKILNKSCDNFPEAACSKCNSLLCVEHEKHCEKCGGALCDDCAISKGIVSKHYFCPKCA